MSTNEQTETPKDKATAAFGFIRTLRRLNIASNPTGIYTKLHSAFNIWQSVQQAEEKK